MYILQSESSKVCVLWNCKHVISKKFNHILLFSVRSLSVNRTADKSKDAMTPRRFQSTAKYVFSCIEVKNVSSRSPYLQYPFKLLKLKIQHISNMFIVFCIHYLNQSSKNTLTLFRKSNFGVDSSTRRISTMGPARGWKETRPLTEKPYQKEQIRKLLDFLRFWLY